MFCRVLLLLVSFVLLAGCEGAERGARNGTSVPSTTPMLPADTSMSRDGGAVDELIVIERDGTGQGTAEMPRGGELRARIDGRQEHVPLPLRHSDMSAQITLHVGSVRLQQTYENPYASKIEAVYVFPLPQNAAVTDFVMQIGDRRIRGIIRERDEARRIYEQARSQGYVASLLTQERPNIFTQSVANIEPGKRIDIAIDYFHTLAYADGVYEFVFPMVVGPRFNPPGSSDGVAAVPARMPGTSGQATEVQYLRPHEISSHMLSLRVDLDAGVEIGKLSSPSHVIDVEREGPSCAVVTLRDGEAIPNRDFVLRYQVAEDDVHGAVAVHREGSGGYFTLVLQPPERMPEVPGRAREMIFVVDCSGSMEGEPLAACQRAMRRCLGRLRPTDTFQVIRFSDAAASMGAKPLAATPENVRRGRRYVDALSADGGTMMMRGIRAALDLPRDPERRRIVTFMTDGFIGNEREILREIQVRIGDARIFSFGVGSSPNRYLMERMALMGRGASGYVGLDGSGERQVDALFRRLEQPALSDIAVHWGGVRVHETYPAPVPDLFVGRPVVLVGQFEGELPDHVRVTGRMGDRAASYDLAVAGRSEHPALAKLWARSKIAHLSDGMLLAAYPDELAREITQVALHHGLVSSFTAFVAADSTRRTEGDFGTTVAVPVPVPAGVRYDTSVGKD